ERTCPGARESLPMAWLEILAAVASVAVAIAAAIVASTERAFRPEPSYSFKITSLFGGRKYERVNLAAIIFYDKSNAYLIEAITKPPSGEAMDAATQRKPSWDMSALGMAGPHTLAKTDSKTVNQQLEITLKDHGLGHLIDQMPFLLIVAPSLTGPVQFHHLVV